MDSDSDLFINYTSPGVAEVAQNSSMKLLPKKSQQKYKITYKDITTSYSENVLMAYFGELRQKIKPNSLRIQYSMLRSTRNVDIPKYVKLKALLKRKSHDYKPKKSKVLTLQEINQFLHEAPDDKYLFTKVNLKEITLDYLLNSNFVTLSGISCLYYRYIPPTTVT
ncbi:hypothetical protein ILUMI_18175 [Ignelater luminosus]|uniref:Uncharacterized protein n=1 Tax=Ignelater luminosus TaxID=2038154 RepID=A0A8K0G758_IGNLU|nr:hypothetical protein ILUMI_18175 [Ignelater luminosus]